MSRQDEVEDELVVIVTGVAGDVGFGVGRILRSVYPKAKLIGADFDADNPALVVYDYFYKSPLASEFSYKVFIKQLVSQFAANVIIPTSEAEIKAFWSLGLVDFLRDIGVNVIILDRDIVSISLDKFKTVSFLKKHNINYPKTILASSFEMSEMPEISFPAIYKPRSGQGSKNVKIIRTIDDLKHLKLSNEFILQEYLSPDSEEYTCCAVGRPGYYKVLLLKRKLKLGHTVSGRVIKNSCIQSYVLSVAEGLKLKGSINIQLRLTDAGPILFEINPRFSSTVVFRHKLGFNDLIWTLEGFGEKFSAICDEPADGVQFYKGVQEYVLHR